VLGKPYAAFAHVSGEPLGSSPPPDSVLLAQLGEIQLPLGVVAGLCTATPEELAELAPGDVWLPAGELWFDRTGRARVALAAPLSARGLAAELTSEGTLVLLGQRVELATDIEELARSMANPNQPAESPTRQVALEAPLVVRVELGRVSLSARQWAELRPGDVLETGQPIGRDAVLRIAGREVARGELVNVDGEIGVRITALVAEEPA
jgi:type III secretion system YscQ/HrcQ family protein